jgi:HK97 family phage major capsid protein
MANQLVAKREELKARQKALADIFEQAGPDLDLGKAEALKGLADTKARADEVRRLNDELTGLGKEVEQLAEVERVAASVKALSQEMQHPARQPETKQPEEVKSLGELFVKSQAFTGWANGRGPSVVVPAEVKTLMSTAAGWSVQNIRQPGFVPHAERIPTVTDIVPMNTTTQAAVLFMEETTFTNNAAERAEGANNAGEAALALTERTSTVRQIPVWIPITQEQMRDVPYVQGYVNNRLGLMLRQRLSSQLLVGNGVAPNLAGLIGLAGVQTQAKGADPTPDAIYKAMTLVEVTGRANPNATVWHPNDWQDVRLLRTADGVYIWGSPSDPGPARIWGLPVIKDSACTENTALVGDFATYCELAMRQEIEMEMTDSHASLFIQYTLAIRAALRAAFVVYRPAAFCQVTGI